MKKRAYRSISVKDITDAKIDEILNGGPLAVGIDVAKEDFVAAVMDEKEVVLLTVKWSHPAESRDFLALVKGLATRTSIAAAMEPSGTYGDSLRWMLNEAKIPVHRVSPKRVHDCAEVYDGVPSRHDAKAAAIIAKLYWDKRSRAWPELTETKRQFIATCKQYAHYHDQLQENLNKLEAELARYWPELSRELALGSATLLALVQEYGSPAAMTARSKQAAEMMRKVGGSLLATEKIQRVIRDAQRSLGVPAVATELRLLKDLAADTRRAKDTADIMRAELERQSAASPAASRMASVVGLATAAIAIAYVGDPLDFDSAAAFEKCTGLNLKTNSSGKKKGRLTITKRGSGLARKYLYMAALRLIQHDAVVQAWHEKKCARDGGTKMKSVVAVMRKLTRALWNVARGEQFDSRKLFDVSRLDMPVAA